MSPNIKRLTLIVFALAALLLVWGGSWYQGLMLWVVGLFGLIWLDKRHIERRLESILPKLYVCAKPGEYLEWVEDLNGELVFKALFSDKLDIYRRSGWLYETGRPQVKPETLQPMKKPSRDPLKQLEKQLITASDRQRTLLNQYYSLWLAGGEAFKNLKPAEVKEAVLLGEDRIPDSDPQKAILVLIGKLVVGKWFLGHQKLQEAERIFSELRETEVFNLMFGEVNYHLGQIETAKKQKSKAAYYYRVAVNFADGTALEADISKEVLE